MYIDLIIRCLLNKQWPSNLEIKLTLPLGKFSNEKIKALGIHWARLVHLKHPDMNFPATSGLVGEEVEDQEL